MYRKISRASLAGRGTPERDTRAGSAREGASDEMMAAVAALNSFQQVTQQADTKASALIAVHVGLTAVIATQFGHASRIHSLAALAAWLTAGTYLAAAAISGYMLAQAIRPRAISPERQNRFALAPPRNAGRISRSYADDVWETSDNVASIARIKNHHVGRAVVWMAVMVITAALWLVISGAAQLDKPNPAPAENLIHAGWSRCAGGTVLCTAAAGRALM
jgi:hypothetical protein